MGTEPGTERSTVKVVVGTGTTVLVALFLLAIGLGFVYDVLSGGKAVPGFAAVVGVALAAWGAFLLKLARDQWRGQDRTGTAPRNIAGLGFLPFGIVLGSVLNGEWLSALGGLGAGAGVLGLFVLSALASDFPEDTDFAGLTDPSA